jgi:BON domain
LWEEVKIVVDKGVVTLEGEVQWQYQRERAELSAQNVRGVTGIINLIAVWPHVAPVEIRHRIEKALRRAANSTPVGSRSRRMAAKSSCKAVRSWAERERAE